MVDSEISLSQYNYSNSKLTMLQSSIYMDNNQIRLKYINSIMNYLPVRKRKCFLYQNFKFFIEIKYFVL
jgi:hypothetical protein